MCAVNHPKQTLIKKFIHTKMKIKTTTGFKAFERNSGHAVFQKNDVSLNGQEGDMQK